MAQLGIRQFRCNGCLSYLVFDRGTREAALLDPHAELAGEYRDYLNVRGLRMSWMLELSQSSEHFSGSHSLKPEYKVPLFVSETSASLRADRRLLDGERLKVGTIELTAYLTPGSTADSMSIYLRPGENHPGALFSGDLLWIGNVGGFVRAQANADAHAKSLQKISSLPASTVLFPGHDFRDLIFSTLEVERSKNPWLRADSARFIQAYQERQPPLKVSDPEKFLNFNLAQNPDSALRTQVVPHSRSIAQSRDEADEGGFQPAPVTTVEKYARKLAEKSAGYEFVDVRDEDEYADGHIPGVKNLPASEMGLHLNELKSARRIYLHCNSGGRATRASNTLCYLGLPDVVNVKGGFKAWQKAEFPIEKLSNTR
jgi:sulfur dioxygenase